MPCSCGQGLYDRHNQLRGKCDICLRVHRETGRWRRRCPVCNRIYVPRSFGAPHGRCRSKGKP